MKRRGPPPPSPPPGPPPARARQHPPHTPSIDERVKVLEKLCTPKKHTIVRPKNDTTLKQFANATKSIPQSAVTSSPFLILACTKVGKKDENIINHLVEFAPQSVSFSSDVLHPKGQGGTKTKAFPIHAACMNECFPDAALRMLVEKNPSALEHTTCILDTGRTDLFGALMRGRVVTTKGLPLQHYLSRRENVNLDIVKLLAGVYPDALKQEGLCTLSLENNADIGIIEYLLKTTEEKEGNMLLHTACSLEFGVASQVVQMIIEKFPQSLKTRDGFHCIPIHTLCKNCSFEFHSIDMGGDNHFYNVLELLIKHFPESAQTEVGGKGDKGTLPLHQYLSKDSEDYQLNVVQLLVRAFPGVLGKFSGSDSGRLLPIQMAILNQQCNYKTIKFLFESSPSSLFSGRLPISTFCSNMIDYDEYDVDEDTKVERLKILKFLVEHDPGSVKLADNNGYLPIHNAVLGDGDESNEICQLLITCFPESLNQRDGDGMLPIHRACRSEGKSSLVKHIVETMPECINIPSEEQEFFGWLPLQLAANSGSDDSDETVRCLLANNCEGLTTSITFGIGGGITPLHLACYTECKIVLPCVQAIYDAHPASIFLQDDEEGLTPPDIAGLRIHTNYIGGRESDESAASFFDKQLSYVRNANDNPLLMTPDENGRLLLHLALQDDDVSFGTIKLLLENNPDAVSVQDNRGMLPIHIASEFKDLDSVKWLMDSSGADVLAVCDSNQEYPLHHACRAGKCKTASHFLQRSTVSISSRNCDGKLPIDLLVESDCEKDDLDYVEAIWLIIRANPDMLGSIGQDEVVIENSSS